MFFVSRVYYVRTVRERQVREKGALDGQTSRGEGAGEGRGQGGANPAAGVEAARRVEKDEVAFLPKAEGVCCVYGTRLCC